MSRSAKCDHNYVVWNVEFLKGGAYSRSKCCKCSTNKVRAINGKHGIFSATANLDTQPTRETGQMNLL
jgi:hypothetical protein